MRGLLLSLIFVAGEQLVEPDDREDGCPRDHQDEGREDIFADHGFATDGDGGSGLHHDGRNFAAGHHASDDRAALGTTNNSQTASDLADQGGQDESTRNQENGGIGEGGERDFRAQQQEENRRRDGHQRIDRVLELELPVLVLVTNLFEDQASDVRTDERSETTEFGPEPGDAEADDQGDR